jgi:putative proteasome-type protease
MRSNISVGLPIDLLIYKADSLRVTLQRRIVETDSYFNMLHQQWGAGLRKVFSELPNPDWNGGIE